MLKMSISCLGSSRITSEIRESLEREFDTSRFQKIQDRENYNLNNGNYEGGTE